VSALRGKRLDADFLNELLIQDPDREMLRWLDDPEGTRARWDRGRWNAFRSLAREHYGFDPEADGSFIGTEKLGSCQGTWQNVWKRFAEAPQRYVVLPEALRRAKPTTGQSILFHSPSWPQDNEEAENVLRHELLQLSAGSSTECRQQLRELDEVHGERRGWVWTALGKAPLATALGHLARLAEATAVPLAGSLPENIAEAYSRTGWKADAAAIDAMALLEKPDDVAPVRTAIQAIYGPWMDEAAEQFQHAVANNPMPPAPADTGVPTGVPGSCVLFADGLRFDVGMRLAALLATVPGLKVESRRRFAPVPSVTSTAKPAAAPIAPAFGGPGYAAEFMPSVRTGTNAGKTLTLDLFRQLLEGFGYRVLAGDETGPVSESSMAWCEYGHLDKHGHDEGWRLAKRIDEEVRALAVRVQALLEAGWKQVRVVTDHGWLLLPGGLPKHDLPVFLTESRWPRCAVLKHGADVQGSVTPWYWSGDVQIGTPPGIACYKAGLEYTHGGLSVQECVVPELVISRAAAAGALVKIQSVEWKRLRCQVRVSKAAVNLSCDMRTSANNPATSLVELPKTIPESGAVSLPVPDDTKEGAAAVVVILDGTGAVLAKQATTVGGDG
jgi:hypothetical protein